MKRSERIERFLAEHGLRSTVLSEMSYEERVALKNRYQELTKKLEETSGSAEREEIRRQIEEVKGKISAGLKEPTEHVSAHAAA